MPVLGAVVAFTILIVIGVHLLENSDPAERSMHQHASNAATVMNNLPPDSSGYDLARSVVGKGGDDTIAVLAASGTRRHGDVLLRIDVTVEPTSEFGSTGYAVGCFEYAFDFNSGNGLVSPNEVSCPSTRPLQLPPPGPTTTTTVS